MITLEFCKCFVTNRRSVAIKIARIPEIDSFITDQYGLLTMPGCIILQSVPIGVRLLKLCTCAPLGRSPQCHTGPEFAAKLFKYLSVHLLFIFVLVDVMKGNAGIYQLQNSEDMEQYF